MFVGDDPLPTISLTTTYIQADTHNNYSYQCSSRVLQGGGGERGEEREARGDPPPNVERVITICHWTKLLDDIGGEEHSTQSCAYIFISPN